MNVVATVGAAAVLTALGSSAFAAGGAAAGHALHRRELVTAARRAIVVAAAFTTLAIATLAYALLTDDFSLAYVASVSSSDMLTHMKWAALYSSQDGSLLFWTWTMSVLMAAFVLTSLRRMPWGVAHGTAACGVVLTAFLAALVFFASPFEVSEFHLADGRGLNPLLVDRGMLVHPPMLLTGLTSTAIPFVIGAAALLAGRVDAAWIRIVRPWAVLSWLILSVGNILGGWWAYTVLGWGGYWGWDPVENSAILPLLPMTAFLHSMMVQERRGMLKLWNFMLVLAAFSLAVFGTFNVRSGLVASVHSFAQSGLGPYFLTLVGLTIGASIVLLAWRAPRMRAEHDFESLVSRESSMIVNNYLFTAMVLVILGGTLFPVFSELIEGTRITVGPPFFNDVVGPLLIALLLLMVAGTVLPWRRASRAALVRRFRVPLALFAGTAIVLALAGVRDPFAVAGLASAATLAYVTLREFALGARGLRNARDVPWPAAALAIFDRDPRRYGGYLVHFGIAIMAVAVIGSTIYQQQVRGSLAPGESIAAGDYTLTYRGITERAGQGNGVDSEVLILLDVYRDGTWITTLEPGRRFFTNFAEQPMTIVDLRTTLRDDLYTFVEGWNTEGVAQVQAFVNPLVAWLWIGAAVYTAGGLIALSPWRATAEVRSEALAPASATPAAGS